MKVSQHLFVALTTKKPKLEGDGYFFTDGKAGHTHTSQLLIHKKRPETVVLWSAGCSADAVTRDICPLSCKTTKEFKL